MTKSKYVAKGVKVYRVDRHYPKGVFVTKFKNEASAAFWIERQEAEDKITRCSHVMSYLAERMARPAPVVVPSNQMELFA